MRTAPPYAAQATDTGEVSDCVSCTEGSREWRGIFLGQKWLRLGRLFSKSCLAQRDPATVFHLDREQDFTLRLCREQQKLWGFAVDGDQGTLAWGKTQM